jgi:murein DD-endopeptidase MepM/ murein hydrolase activator NlpD
MTKKLLSKSFYLFILLILLTQQVVTPFIYAQEENEASLSAQQDGESEGEQKNEELNLPETQAGVDNDTLKPTFESKSPSTITSAYLRQRVFLAKLTKKVFSAKESITLDLKNAKENTFKLKVTDRNNKEVAVIAEEKMVGEDKEVTLAANAQMTPGIYHVIVEDSQGVVSNQEFVWGVLALNPDRDVYLPHEEATIAMAVLDEKGEMVCDAKVTLTITTPVMGKDILSTSDGSVVQNPACFKKEMQLEPDYQANYTPVIVGEYKLSLKAETKNGIYSIDDSFSVVESAPYRIKRVTATRLYPPETYPVTISFTAEEDFDGVVTEVVPESFVVDTLTGKAAEGVNTEFSSSLVSADGERKKVLGDTSVALLLPFTDQERSSESAALLNEFPVSLGFGLQLSDPVLKVKYSDFGLIGHDGMDFAMDEGTDILAADSGTVVLAEEMSDYGTTIVIEHTWGKTYYGHLSELKVKKGDQVVRGVVIGLSGDTGISTGPHLHFGVKPNETDNTNGFFGKVNPASYLGIKDESSVLGASISTDERVKLLSWKVKAKKGQTVSVGYTFNAPDVSPQYYTLGPVKIFDDEGKKIYEEQRFWQLAVDAYAGRTLKTVEYILGGGTDLTLRTTGQTVYAGTSFNTTKGSAGEETIILEGTDISVRNAYIESRFNVATAADVTDVDMLFDADPGPNANADTRISPVVNTGASYWDSSGPSGWIVTRADITSQFEIQDDTEWAAGVSVVAGIQVTGPSYAATTMKIVITYEQDYSTTAHTEIKTVRFPLDSTVSGDTGSTRAACAGSATCSFNYNADIPDLLGDDNANIESVWFEITGMYDSATAASFTPQINGGTAGAAVSQQEVIADVRDLYVHYEPLVGGSDFVPNAAGQLDIVNGTVPINVLGGELVITYQYDTSETVQTETVRYWIEQDTAENGTTKTVFPDGASNITISNTGLSVKNLWYKVRTAHSAAQTFTVYGNVGSAGEKSNAYTLTGTNARAGEATIIYDMSADASSFSSSTTKVAGASQFSSATGDTEVGVELYATFTWSGDDGGTQTKSVLYNGRTSPMSSNVATEYHNFPMNISLPEKVTKTHRSSYIQSTVMHSEATTIAVSTITGYLNGSSILSLTEQDDTEAFARTYYASMSATVFNGAATNTIPFDRRAFMYSGTTSQADEFAMSNAMVVTYDAAFTEDGTTVPEHSLRTVEYVLGGGSDTSSRTTGTNVYAGSSWNTTKGSAGTTSVDIPGSDIQVRNAYVESRISVSNAVNVTDVDMLFDATPGPNPGTDGRISPVINGTYAETTGQGYWLVVRADVTSQISTQSDSDWNNGVDIVAGLQVTGPTTQLNSMKLVITYEQEYSETAHDELKTVRFPLDSDVSGDTGSSRAACAASATCTFSYNADIPDLLNTDNANIESVFFEIHALSDSATAPSFTPQIQSGTAGSSHSDGEALADMRDMYVLYQPLVGGSDFLPNTAGKLDIVNGGVDLNGLGGELIVTYKFSTDAPTQTETVRYFAEQDTAENGTTKTAFTRSSYTISNTGADVKNIWFRVTTAPSAAQTFTVFGNVGSAGEKSNAYTLTGTNPRGGEAVVIYDMSADAASFNAATTTVTGASQFSSATGDTEVGAEIYITFTWSGDNFGTQTKSVLFTSGTSGAAPTVGSEYLNFPVSVFLPETVTKTHRSTYVQNTLNLGDATTINNGTITLTTNGISALSMTTQDDTEAFTATRLHEISSTNFSEGSTILFKRKTFMIGNTYSGADRYNFSNVFVVTYDAGYAAGGVETPALSQLMRHGKWFNSSGVRQPFTF